MHALPKTIPHAKKHLPRKTGRVRVYVLALEQGLLSTVAAPLEVFRLVGLSPVDLGLNTQPPFFDVRVVGLPGAVQSFGGVDLQLADVANMPRPDVVFIGSGGLQVTEVAPRHAALGVLLRRWHQAGSCIAAVCTGVVVLAECGLLQGRRATTHWAVAGWFRARYPEVRLQEDQMVTQDAQLWCGAGGYAALDLALQLAEHFAGPTAVQLARQTLLLDAPRAQQRPYAGATSVLAHQDAAVAQVQRMIRLDVARCFSVAELAEACCLSMRTMMRRFKLATGTTVLDYQQNLRMQEAKQRLTQGTHSVVDIALAVGYEDSAFFRSVFKRKVGVTPSEFRQRTRSHLR